ncbi:hypothetical protein WOLCODRAFT_145119 [Wolfiporia cocos MD-104 SS10]|uniref:RING-type domain-containing protein n=1 Tax=Wolfiporia cocos (strain MD-104) TaxID=742152 RepID=A0A2H3K8A8_WOLCO|nr:hypothetical protein WOLCODRAFT_145119 [Wolfiporia cocos MD-104 SS10]
MSTVELLAKASFVIETGRYNSTCELCRGRSGMENFKIYALFNILRANTRESATTGAETRGSHLFLSRKRACWAAYPVHASLRAHTIPWNGLAILAPLQSALLSQWSPISWRIHQGHTLALCRSTKTSSDCCNLDVVLWPADGLARSLQPVCNVSFWTDESRHQHYFTSSSHPKCDPCMKGFQDQLDLDAHNSLAHAPAKVKCNPCGKLFTPAELQQHYNSSPAHPNCIVCETGFETNALHKQHITTAHPDSRCSVCARLFRDKAALQDHFNGSSMHPSCAICEIGFLDDAACDEHMVTAHPPRKPETPPAPPMILQEDEKPSPLEHTFAPSLITQSEVRSLPASPLFRPSSAASAHSEDVTLATPSSIASELVSDNYSMPHVPRTASEPSMFSTSSLDPASDSPTSSHSPSPAVSQRTLDFVSVHATVATRPESVRSLSSMSVRSISGSDAMREQSHTSNVPTPSATPKVASSTLPSAYSGVSSGRRTPQMPSPPRSGRQSSSSSVRPSSALSVRPSTPRTQGVKEDPEAAAQTPISRPASVASQIPSRNSELALSVPSSTVSTESDETAQEDATRNAARQVQQSTPTTLPPSKAISWHCRICLKDPCDQPTATMCGHVFCNSCIIKELTENMQCPVCKKVMLLRLY